MVASDTEGAVLSQTPATFPLPTFPATSEADTDTVLVPSAQLAERAQTALPDTKDDGTDEAPHPIAERLAETPVEKSVPR